MLTLAMITEVLYLSPQTFPQKTLAEEISLPSPDGQILKLSALKGQLVLLEFWASWNRSSRLAHTQLINTYRIYSTKKFINGSAFNIFSVSLDKYKEAWTTAISQDALPWPNQVCSFKYWNCSAVVNYHVASLPCYFLIDKDGFIIRQLNSIDELEKILNSFLQF